MAARHFRCQGKTVSDKEKNERLAAALRENLRRRKAQARSRATAVTADRIAETHDSAGIGDDKP